MINQIITLMLTLFCATFISAQGLIRTPSMYEKKILDEGTFELKMKFNEPGIDYTGTSTIFVKDGVATVNISFTMTNPKTAKTNKVEVRGKGSGTCTVDGFNATGSGSMNMYENEKADTHFEITFTMTGTVSKSGNMDFYDEITGDFNFVEEGENVGGTFTARNVSGGDSGGRFSGITGDVQVLDPQTNEWSYARFETQLKVGAHIKTGEDSQVILSFTDMNTFVMKPESEVIIASPSDKESKFIVAAGTIWINVKHLVIDGTMEVEMNQVSAGIKGTTFVVSEDGTTSTLKVIEGVVALTSKATHDRIDVKTGEMVSGTSRGLSQKTTFNVENESADWDKVKGQAKTNTGIGRWLTLPYIIGGSVMLLLIIILILFLALRKPKHKKTVMNNMSMNQPMQQPPMQQHYTPPVNINSAPPVQNYQPPQNFMQPQNNQLVLQFCPSCGTKLKPNAKFCHICARKL